MNTIKFSKRTEPYIPVGHPDYVWRSHADVQSTWRRFGWTPPYGQPSTPILRELVVPAWGMTQIRRVR